MSHTGVEFRDVQAETITISGVIVGLTAPEVQELTKAAAAGAVGPLADKIVDLSQRLGVTQGTMLTMLATIGQANVPDEHLAAKLAEVLEQVRMGVQCAIVLGQLSEFRSTIHRAAHAFDRQLEEANYCRERGDVKGAEAALLQSARSCGEIITAYKLHGHLFSEPDRLEIEREVAAAEKGEGSSLGHLFTAVQLINAHAERAVDAQDER